MRPRRGQGLGSVGGSCSASSGLPPPAAGVTAAATSQQGCCRAAAAAASPERALAALAGLAPGAGRVLMVRRGMPVVVACPRGPSASVRLDRLLIRRLPRSSDWVPRSTLVGLGAEPLSASAVGDAAGNPTVRLLGLLHALGAAAEDRDSADVEASWAASWAKGDSKLLGSSIAAGHVARTRLVVCTRESCRKLGWRLFKDGENVEAGCLGSCCSPQEVNNKMWSSVVVVTHRSHTLPTRGMALLTRPELSRTPAVQDHSGLRTRGGSAERKGGRNAVVCHAGCWAREAYVPPFNPPSPPGFRACMPFGIQKCRWGGLITGFGVW